MIRNDLSNADYHASDGISSSDVKTVLLNSVWHWHHAVHKSSPAMDIGTAVHDIRLEGGKNIIRGPETRRGNAWKEALTEADFTKKLLLTEGDYDKAQAIAATLLEDDVCKKTLEAPNAKIEHSIFVECPETGLKLRCRPDLYDPDKKVMADIKCTVDPSPQGFVRQCYKYRYDAQSFFYTYVAQLAGWEVTHFAFLAAGNTEPYISHMHIMSMDAMQLAKNDVMRALKDIAEAKQTNTYKTGWERFTMLNPPKWMADNLDFDKGE